MRGATGHIRDVDGIREISIHAPHAGSDIDWIAVVKRPGISIHAPHAGSDGHIRDVDGIREISIHAPHAGSDCFSFFCSPFSMISIHAPHAGSDVVCDKSYQKKFEFQSTLPMRGATH